MLTRERGKKWERAESDVAIGAHKKRSKAPCLRRLSMTSISAFVCSLKILWFEKCTSIAASVTTGRRGPRDLRT